MHAKTARAKLRQNRQREGARRWKIQTTDQAVRAAYKRIDFQQVHGCVSIKRIQASVCRASAGISGGPSQMAAADLGPVLLPQLVTVKWVTDLQQRLDTASRAGLTALKAALPRPVAVALLERTERLLQAEPPLVEASRAACCSTVQPRSCSMINFRAIRLVVKARSQHLSLPPFNRAAAAKGPWCHLHCGG